MTIENFLEDVVTGKESSALARIKDWWSGVSKGIRAVVSTLATDEGKILQGLLSVAAQDVVKGGFTTPSFVAAAVDVGEKLLAQNITMLNTVIFSALNAEVNNQAAAAGIAVPTNAGTSQVPKV